MDGDQISFKAGNSTFSGTLKGEQIELRRTANLGFPMPEPAKEEANRPAVGPPPDGSDPSINPSWLRQPNTPILLHRVQH